MAVKVEAKEVKRLQSIARVGQVTDAFYEDLRQAGKQGKKICWVGGYPTIFPILRAMDIPYLFEDVYAATAAARHKEKKLQEVSANVGYLQDICSYARTTLGMAYYPEAEKQKPDADPYYLMPKPDYLVYMDVGCSMITNWSDAGRRHFGNLPMFEITTPYIWSQADEEDCIQDLAQQFRELVPFLEDVSGRKLDPARLRAVMAEVKEAITYRVEAMTMAGRAVPCPATFFDWATSLGAVNYAIGTPLCTELFRNMKAEIQERISRGEGSLPEEKIRVYWEGHMCWPYLRWWGETLTALGVNIIAAKYTHGHFFHRPDRIDPDKPFESLAANSVTHLSRNIPLLIDEVTHLCRDFAVDAVICHQTRSCRIFPGAFFELADALARRLGLPATTFEGDVADGTFFAPEQARTRLEALVETVHARRAAVHA